MQPSYENDTKWPYFGAVVQRNSKREFKNMRYKTQAAIASRQAGELYGLKILAENICYNGQNATRFVIVSKKPIYVKDAHKISIFFELHHESGTLYNMLSHIIIMD